MLRIFCFQYIQHMLQEKDRQRRHRRGKGGGGVGRTPLSPRQLLKQRVRRGGLERDLFSVKTVGDVMTIE
jgi:hypothetical protein